MAQNHNEFQLVWTDFIESLTGNRRGENNIRELLNPSDYEAVEELTPRQDGEFLLK